MVRVVVSGHEAFGCAEPTWCPHTLGSNSTKVTDLTPRAVLSNCALAERLPLPSPTTARLGSLEDGIGSLEDGSQLSLVTFVTFPTFSTVLAFSALSALATIVTFSLSGLAPALAVAVAIRVALAIALRGDDRFPSG